MQDNLLENNEFYLAPITTFQTKNEEIFDIMSPPITPATKKYNSLSLGFEKNSTAYDKGNGYNEEIGRTMITNFNLSPPLTIHGSPDLQYGEVYQEGYEYETQPMYQFMHGSMDPQHLDQPYEDFVPPPYHHQVQQLHHSQSDASLNSWASGKQQSFDQVKPFEQHHLQSEWQVTEPQGSYKCTFPGCQKVFSKQTNLKSHSRIHHTERNYSCDDCGSSFRRSHDLKRHQRSLHSDVKPFPCQKCGKRFSRMDALKRHTSRQSSTCFSQNF